MNSDGEQIQQAKRHYRRGEVDGIIYDLNDHAFVKVSSSFIYLFISDSYQAFLEATCKDLHYMLKKKNLQRILAFYLKEVFDHY